ncbi:MAG: efflux transporter outer membrane subunit [Proteobacteria bacterium]|nr:efflux transporter outer membrane subunit [Pseudomonadota bacterium]
MKPRLLLTAVLPALALAACAFVPRQAPQGVSLDAAAMGLSPTEQDRVAAGWWHEFGDPQLDALVAAATRDSPSLGEALARLERARAEASAAGAPRLPRVDLTGSEVRERFSERYIIPPPYGGGVYWDGQLALGADYNLDLWGRQRAVIHAAQRGVRARELDLAAAALALEGAVVSGYLDYDRALALAELAREGERIRSELATLVRRREAAGLDTGLDRRTADAAIPETRVDREQLQAAAEITRHRLAALAGHGARDYAQLKPPALAVSTAAPLPAALPGDLLLRRADVRAALERVQAASSGVDAARLAAYPDINLRAYAGFAALTLGDLVSAPSRTWGVGPSISLPIFDAGRIRAGARTASADLDAAVAAYNATVVEAVRQAADGLTLVDSLGRQRAEAEQRVELLAGASRLADERFRGGLATRLTVLEADGRLLAARRTLVAARNAELGARVSLILALGGGALDAPTAPLADSGAAP